MDNIRLLTNFLVIILLLSGCTAKDQQTQTTQAFFCPQDGCEQRVISAISGADSTVDIAMYSMTSEEIARALGSAGKSGVRVRIVGDYLQSQSKYSLLEELGHGGAEVRIMPRNTVMHNKFAVIDGQTTITGSYNWTYNANVKNRENLVFIKDMATAQNYEGEFFNLWIEAD